MPLRLDTSQHAWLHLRTLANGLEHSERVGDGVLGSLQGSGWKTAKSYEFAKPQRRYWNTCLGASPIRGRTANIRCKSLQVAWGTRYNVRALQALEPITPVRTIFIVWSLGALFRSCTACFKITARCEIQIRSCCLFRMHPSWTFNRSFSGDGQPGLIQSIEDNKVRIVTLLQNARSGSLRHLLFPKKDTFLHNPSVSPCLFPRLHTYPVGCKVCDCTGIKLSRSLWLSYNDPNLDSWWFHPIWKLFETTTQKCIQTRFCEQNSCGNPLSSNISTPRLGPFFLTRFNNTSRPLSPRTCWKINKTNSGEWCMLMQTCATSH